MLLLEEQVNLSPTTHASMILICSTDHLLVWIFRRATRPVKQLLCLSMTWRLRLVNQRCICPTQCKHGDYDYGQRFGQLVTEQATLGSLINRFNFSINNLSKASVTTEQAVGRIMDADFATETTNLSKQQILNQAATSMLAQANQSKQSILALQ